ncbi:leucine-rich repeat protein [Mycoplasma sp. 4F]|uniref:leucine-rich repeat protein n=1 Tax=Mycoplasma sp. 4F TaxID=3401664 RepID=UPI003AAA8111
MKRKKLFIIFSFASASSIITMPLVAGSCNNKNNENNPESKPIVTPAPNPGTTPKLGDTPKPTPIITTVKKDNNTYSFLYTDNNKKTNGKYYKNENKIVIQDAQDITAKMLTEIFNYIHKNYDINNESFILDCPEAKRISLKFERPSGMSSVKIKKLNLPKIENVINNKDGGSEWLNHSLEEDKVVQNGILFQWNNAYGDIEDKTIRKIVAKAFRWNERITSINFPNVEYIDPNAFGVVYTGYPLKEEYPPLINIKTNKLVINGTLLKWSDASGDIADDSITSIAGGVFINNQEITSVSFPNVTSVGDRAFANTWMLKSASLPKATSIGWWAFKDAHDLTAIDIPNLKEVGWQAFDGTSYLKSKIVINGKLTRWDGASGDIADDSVTSIAANVFKNNQNITSASFPNVTSIEDSAFEGAINLVSVDIPNLKQISHNAFENTPKLMSKIAVDGKLIKWVGASGDIADDNITSIAADAFKNNQNITSASFPNVTSIEKNAFEGAINLVSVSFPNVTSIENETFKGAINLTLVNMSKLEQVGYRAFENTPKLTNKIVAGGKLIKWSNASGDIADDSVTSIAAGVFKNNQNITSASFPNVTKIGYESFAGATNLVKANFPKLEYKEYNAFENTPKLINKPTEKWN